ncbi:MAG TPA: F420-0--gamma-glutamyl ligase [Firmicutes bacterium]|nr:F420-0--gamma-glutamyl ligase [Bacillota bacterium]
MTRTVGTTARGIRAPIIKRGDDLVNIVVDSVINSMVTEKYSINDKDIIGVTESLVARAQGNYASVDDIAIEINRKFDGDIAVVFPILSRNRFSTVLKGILMSGKKVHVILNYPSDELGNHLMDVDLMDDLGINPYTDVLTTKEYRKLFGDYVPHPFTGVDYVSLYEELATDNNIEIYLANNPKVALQFSKEVLVCNVHERQRTKKRLTKYGAKRVLGLDDLLTEPINGSGYNPEYGLLGSNKATETEVKLFPRDCNQFVRQVQKILQEKINKKVEVLVYGDGAFKDPQGRIWELADPVVCPGYTDGLSGTPNEIKLKYLADSAFAGMEHDKMTEAIKKRIKEKDIHPSSQQESMGTTPRKITDLLGSLCDLTSGSGDKGTPIVLIQGYFDNYVSE